MPLKTWFEGIEEMLVRVDGGLARWSEGNYDSAKTNRVFYDFAEAEFLNSDVGAKRPYFTVTEGDVSWEAEAEDHVIVSAASYRVRYTEALSNPDDHKASKLDFVEFFGSIMEFIAANQGRPIAGLLETSYLPIKRIQVSQSPVRGVVSQEDSGVTGTSYFWAEMMLHIV